MAGISDCSSPTPDSSMYQQLHPMSMQAAQNEDIYTQSIAHKMPWYYDAFVEKHVSYAYSYSYFYGPHTDTICDCPECVKFNDDFQSKAELAKLHIHIDNTAQDAAQRYFGMRPSPDGDDSYYAANALRKFAQEHISRYQKEMVERVRKMQAAHAQQIAAMKHELSKKNITTVPVQHPNEGRLFRMGEQEETA